MLLMYNGKYMTSHMMQALSDLGVPSAMKNLVKTAAFKALRVQRDENPYALAVYLHAAVGNLFLQSVEGTRQLRAADMHGRALLDASMSVHQTAGESAVAAYGWTLIRKMHPRGPGPLHLWGEDKYKPSEDSAGKNTSTSYKISVMCLFCKVHVPISQFARATRRHNCSLGLMIIVVLHFL